MTEQLSIFDFLGEFATVPEEEMVQRVGQKLGIKFTQEVLPKGTYCSHLDYEYKHKGLRLTVGYITSHEGELWISAGYSKGTSGGGGPFDSIDDVVKYFERIIKEHG